MTAGALNSLAEKQLCGILDALKLLLIWLLVLLSGASVSQLIARRSAVDGNRKQ